MTEIFCFSWFIFHFVIVLRSSFFVLRCFYRLMLPAYSFQLSFPRPSGPWNTEELKTRTREFSARKGGEKRRYAPLISCICCFFRALGCARGGPSHAAGTFFVYTALYFFGASGCASGAGAGCGAGFGAGCLICCAGADLGIFLPNMPKSGALRRTISS